MPAPKEILTLVEQFKRKRDELKASRYKEASLRVEFLDPFLETLGWDVRNTQGHAEAFKEVIHEDAIRIGDAMKAPDYCMRIGHDRKFFVEAKKPSVDIKGAPGPAYQLRRYAWSAKLPLSILTDFEEFAVYDCRSRPKSADKASVARIHLFTFEEYAARWDEIAAIFSKDAVLQGSFDKYAGEKRHGTQEVDDEFLKEIEHWRELLAKNIANRNPTLGQQEMNYAVQQTIDRMIFLRICEDRGIEQYGRLMAEMSGSDTYERLKQLFRDADGRYNSGLFHFREEKGQGEPPDMVTPHLTIDDAVLKEIIASLYDGPYAFAVIPPDILGHVYEQFLGKVIRLTEGHHAKVEEKPEVRKAGGVYYTPKYIVDYIVEHTVGKLLESKTPKKVAELKIVDPACGSGSFLLGAYQYLLDWHLKYYLEHDPKKWKKELCSISARHGEPVEPDVRAHDTGYRLSISERKRILLSTIFGVDIDPQAVEVTKLSLLLKVLEGETGLTAQQQLSGMRERVLPDLGANIKCGNSLIGSDFYDGEQQTLLATEDTDRQRINVFDWEPAFPQVFKRANPGFDAVIGNPPYLAGREWEDEMRKLRSYFKTKFSCMTDQYDLYALFLQKAYDLLRKDGYLGFITPNTWLNNEHYYLLRKYVMEVSQIQRIGDFRNVSVFSGATVLPIVFIAISRKSSDLNTPIVIENYESQLEFKTHKITPMCWRSNPNLVFNLSVSATDISILNKIEKIGEPLSNTCDVRFGVKVYQVGKGLPPQTEQEAKQKLFESDKKIDSSFYPYIRGKHITPYQIYSGGSWIKYGVHLAEPRTIDLFSGPRVLIRRIVGDRLVLCPVSDLLIADQLLHTVKPRNGSVDSKYVAALLGSRLIAFYFKKRYDRTENTFPEIRIGELNSLPLCINSNMHVKEQIINLVDKMLSLHKLHPKTPHDQESLKRQIEVTDRKIDELVYELYGLTEEEKAIIEKS